MSTVHLKEGPYTVDYIFQLQDDRRYEIYDGEIFMVPPPALMHQHASSELHLRLGRYLQEHQLGKVYYSPVALILSDKDYVEPDLVYVSNHRRDILTERGIEGASELVVEVLSPSTRSRDLGVKATIYARFGVPHYWVLDPAKRTLSTFALQDDKLVETGCYRETFKPTLFPGLEIEVAELWFETR